MKMIPVNEIPRRGRHDLQNIINEFVNGNDDIVRIDYNDRDYKSAKVCYCCFWNAVTRSGFRYIKVVKRGNEVYLRRIVRRV